MPPYEGLAYWAWPLRPLTQHPLCKLKVIWNFTWPLLSHAGDHSPVGNLDCYVTSFHEACGSVMEIQYIFAVENLLRCKSSLSQSAQRKVTWKILHRKKIQEFFGFFCLVCVKKLDWVMSMHWMIVASEILTKLNIRYFCWRTKVIMKHNEL